MRPANSPCWRFADERRDLGLDFFGRLRLRGCFSHVAVIEKTMSNPFASLPRSAQPPEVRITTEGVINWDEFACWSARNTPLWNSALNYCAVAGLGREPFLKAMVYHLTIENKQMKDTLIKHAQETGKPLFTP